MQEKLENEMISTHCDFPNFYTLLVVEKMASERDAISVCFNDHVNASPYILQGDSILIF